jgi:hypothetical protein
VRVWRRVNLSRSQRFFWEKKMYYKSNNFRKKKSLLSIKNSRKITITTTRAVQRIKSMWNHIASECSQASFLFSHKEVETECLAFTKNLNSIQWLSQKNKYWRSIWSDLKCISKTRSRTLNDIRRKNGLSIFDIDAWLVEFWWCKIAQ